MVLRKNINKLLIILLSLITATAVSASPTMSDCNKNFIVRAVSPTADAHVPYVPETSQITEPFNSRLAAIGAEILEPPPEFTDFSPVGAKTLPPVPAAFFMVLTGFLCVSLVRDRRVWLAALASLLWAGQAGFQAIPQLATNISKHIQRKTTANIALLHRSEDLCRLRSDIEGTQYIGLLHHLAGIPDATVSLLPHIPASWCRVNSVRDKLQQIRNLAPERSEGTQFCPRAKRRDAILPSSEAKGRNTNEAPQFAITHSLSLLNPALICPAAIAEQNTCFSPAFIFARLARGPPNFT